MLHQDREKTQVTNIGRWKSERGGLFSGRGPTAAGCFFDEDLALFERQAREEVRERVGVPAGPVSREALSA